MHCNLRLPNVSSLSFNYDAQHTPDFRQILFSIDLFLFYRTDFTDSRTILCFYSAQRLDVFAWCVRLSQLLVGFRTHLIWMHFHSFIHFIHPFISAQSGNTRLSYWWFGKHIFRPFFRPLSTDGGSSEGRWIPTQFSMCCFVSKRGRLKGDWARNAGQICLTSALEGWAKCLSLSFKISLGHNLCSSLVGPLRGLRGKSKFQLGSNFATSAT